MAILGQLLDGQSQLVCSTAVETSRCVQTSMKVNDTRTSGSLMKVVDVLSHDGQLWNVIRKLGDSQVCRIRCGLKHL